MFKSVVVGIVFSALFSGVAAAGPFGLSMGMKKLDFKGELDEIAPYKYQTSTVPKPHSAFESYVVTISPKNGLCYIKAVGKDIPTSTYGLEVQRAFDDMEAKLKKVYGNNKRLDFVRYGSIWDEPRDWMPGLIKKERMLAALWNSEQGSILKDNLKAVGLGSGGIDRSTGYLVIDYAFTNEHACDEEIAATEDGAL